MTYLPLFMDANEALDHHMKASSLTDAERALVVGTLSKAGYTNQKIRAVLNIPHVYTVTHLARVGKSLSIDELNLWYKNPKRITLGHLRAIAKMPRPQREALMRELLTRKIAVHKFEALARDGVESVDVDIRRYEELMGDAIGRNVKISFDQAKRSGSICLGFFGLDDLDNISEMLGFKAREHI